MDIHEECEIFRNPAGRIAIPHHRSEQYSVSGSYLDPNGCMVTYGIDLGSGEDRHSFIVDTDYKEASDVHPGNV